MAKHHVFGASKLVRFCWEPKCFKISYHHTNGPTIQSSPTKKKHPLPTASVCFHFPFVLRTSPVHADEHPKSPRLVCWVAKQLTTLDQIHYQHWGAPRGTIICPFCALHNTTVCMYARVVMCTVFVNILHIIMSVCIPFKN